VKTVVDESSGMKVVLSGCFGSGIVETVLVRLLLELKKGIESDKEVFENCSLVI
jgi:hypothetical protein